MTGAFFVQDDERTYLATGLTRGPWDVRFQHGGPPCALLARAIGEWPGDFAVARLLWDFRRPVPIGRLDVDVTPVHLGRTAQRLHATLSADGAVVLEAQGLRIRRDPGSPVADPPLPDWPPPEALETHELSFFLHEEGFHRAVELRMASGPWGVTPARVWARPRVPLVADQPTTALERTAILADAQSGMGPPLDPHRFNYANPDLALFLDRMPEGDWLGFDIRSSAQPDGIGLSQALIRDARGAFGRSAQTLVISERPAG